MQLWEILVPATWNDGTPVKVRHHRVWDRKVQELTGGLTIMRPAKGRWKAVDGTVYHDRVIPVRFAIESDGVEEIMHFTCEHYDQLAIMCYRVSEEVFILTREQLGVTKPFWRKTNVNEFMG